MYVCSAMPCGHSKLYMPPYTYKIHRKCYVGRNGKRNQQTLHMHTSVWIAQDTTESRVPRLNVHTNQILAHTFSHGTLDSVTRACTF